MKMKLLEQMMVPIWTDADYDDDVNGDEDNNDDDDGDYVDVAFSGNG